MNTVFNSLTEEVRKQFNQDSGILMLNVSTEDGFVMAHESSQELDIQADKIAAMSSSLSSIANSSVKMLKNCEYNIMLVEASSIDLLFMSSIFGNKKCVISTCVSSEISPARSRFMLKRFSEILSSIAG